MKKFDKVKKALEDKTRNTNNFVTLSINNNASHKYKYITRNVVTNNISKKSYKTLNDIIKEYELNI